MAQTYRPDPRILELGDAFYDPVEAADFPQTILRFRNERSAETVGLDGLGDDEWIRHFGRFEPLPDNLAEPLALRYHGHQFRVYNPDIGDGRGFLFAQLRDGAGPPARPRHQGLGPDPLQPLRRRPADAEGRGARGARHRDARGARRRDLEDLLADRDRRGARAQRRALPDPLGGAGPAPAQPYPDRHLPAARLLPARRTISRKLTDYCLRHYYGDEGGDDAPARLLAHVAGEAARLAASYIAAGFVHGVLNSDNIAITAQSFDYGPWRCTPFWDGHFTAAYFDHAGLYSFGRQPEAIHWDLLQLAASLRTIAEAEALTPALDAFPGRFQRRCATRIFARLGIRPGRARATTWRLLVALETALAAQDGRDRPLLLRLARRPAARPLARRRGL